MRAARHSQERVNNRMLRCRRVYYVRTLGKEGGKGGQGTRLRGVDGTNPSESHTAGLSPTRPPARLYLVHAWI